MDDVDPALADVVLALTTQLVKRGVLTAADIDQVHEMLTERGREHWAHIINCSLLYGRPHTEIEVQRARNTSDDADGGN